MNYSIANQHYGSEPEESNINWLLDTENSLFINRSQTNFAGSHAEVADWAGRYAGVMLTIPNGNTLIETPNTTAEGRTQCQNLWNGICVGWYAYNTYDDAATHRRYVGSATQGSTYLNPYGSPLLERPHLLGPGGHQGVPNALSGLHMPKVMPIAGTDEANEMTNRVLQTSGAEILGSSFASPAVLGAAIVALEYEGFFSALANPIVNKAVLLAATVDSNADGAVGSSNLWAHSSTVDYEDGAGHIDFIKLKAILAGNRYYSLLLTDSDFSSCGSGCREYVVAAITVPGKGVPKISLAWSACADVEAAPFVNNDLDLLVVPPSGCNGGNALISDSGITSEIELLRSPCLPVLTNTTWTIKIRIKNGASLNSCGVDASERVGVAWGA